ncbi:MAG: hypothetical protein Ta2A_13840 [Treponemataceae bacterium]|nr:MAG: hypothetical protein Ta2A_13840 [Treponemataceae bacterium]
MILRQTQRLPTVLQTITKTTAATGWCSMPAKGKFSVAAVKVWLIIASAIWLMQRATPSRPENFKCAPSGQVGLYGTPIASWVVGSTSEIHAIINTVDIDGQRIDHNAMQSAANGYQTGRWLIHDRYSFKTGADTNYAWSAGCFIVSSGDLEAFNKMLHAYKVGCADVLSGEVVEVW